VKQKAMSIVAAAAVLMALLVAWWGTGSTQSAFTATVRNPTNTSASGLLAAAATPNTATCDTRTSATSTSTAQCDGTLLATVVPTTGTTAKATTVTNTGTIAATTAAVQAQSCAPIALANSRDSSDPMLPHYATTFAQNSAPAAADASLGLDGSTAYAADVTSGSAGTNSSLGIWFRAPTTSPGGVLLGLSSAPGTGSAAYDRILWMDSAGKLNFTYRNAGGTTTTASTTSSYRDNAWHFVSATLTYGVVIVFPVVTYTLYVDGASKASNSVIQNLTAPTGYWHAGYGSMTGAASYFTGSLANAFAMTNDLTAAQTSTLAGSTSSAQWQANLAAAGAGDAWSLGDAGTATYAGPYPTIGSASPCASIAAIVNAVSTTLGALLSTPAAITAPAVGASAGLTISISRAGGYDTTFVPGLHLLVPMSIVERAGGWATTLSYATSKQQVIA
jgi:hypothetical protein